MGQLFDELKRRNVIRVAVAYAVAAWVLLQIVDLVLENINAPDWVVQAFMLALAIGLPLVLIFAWAFELTPEGLKREKDVDRDKSVTHETAKKLDQVTIALLVLVVVFVFVEGRFFPAAGNGPVSGGVVDDKSIAVLAFEDLSPEGDQAYFADGLSEELLNLLAQIPDLQVAGRTSSFAFKGQHRDLREVGEILNVAHVLEGSVRKAGNRIRVTAQLVSAADGFHLFSETYDDNLNDIFKVQDDIAQKITAALKSQLIGGEDIAEVPETNVRAYELYLEARQKIHTRDGVELAQASSLLDAALVIAPDYVPALTQKALAVALLSDAGGAYGDIPVAIAYEEANGLLQRALQLDPGFAEAHAVLGLIEAWESKATNALPHLDRALELNPNLDNAALWRATVLGYLGRYDEANAQLERVIERNPLFPPAFNNLVEAYIARRDYDRATSLIDRFERGSGKTSAVSYARARVDASRGEYANAIRHYRAAHDADPSSSVLRFNYGFALWILGILEPLPELGLAPFDSIYYLETGDDEQALAVVNAAPIVAEDIGTFRMRSYAYHRTGHYDAILADVDKYFGGLDSLLENHPRTTESGLSWMPDLAVTYRELGRDAEHDKVLAAIRSAVAAQRELPIDPFSKWYGAASLAAIEGDADAMLAAFQKIVDANDADVEPLASSEYRPYRADPRFQPIMVALSERADEERAKLGLPPYEPLLQSAVNQGE